MILAILAFSVCVGSIALEPSCSPFEYEEKILSKVIRQEYKYEKLMEDMLAIQNQVNQKLTELDMERERFRVESSKERESLQSQVNATLDAIEKDRGILKAELQAVVQNNAEHLKTQEEKFETFKDGFNSSVAFFSKNVADTTPNNGQIFIFSEAVINEANGYSPTTGKFTAPVAGLYKFNMQLCLIPGSLNYIGYELRTNKEKIQAGFFRDYDSHNCITAGSLVRLQTGDTVWIQCYNCGGNMYQDYNNGWNTFSGFLIHP